jgi:hypothetical protein
MVEEDVLRLQVAVDYAAGVQVPQGDRDLRDIEPHVRWRYRVAYPPEEPSTGTYSRQRSNRDFVWKE